MTEEKRPTDPEELSRRRSPAERPKHYDIDVVLRRYGPQSYILACYDDETDTINVCVCCDRCGPETLPWDEVKYWRYEYAETE